MRLGRLAFFQELQAEAGRAIMARMPERLMPNTVAASSARIPTALAALAMIAAVLVATAGTLWAYFGTTVFYEMIAAGLAYCF